MLRVLKHLIKEFKYIRIRNKVQDFLESNRITSDARLRSYLTEIGVDNYMECKVLQSLLHDSTIYRDIHEDLWYAQRTPKFDKSE